MEIPLTARRRWLLAPPLYALLVRAFSDTSFAGDYFDADLALAAPGGALDVIAQVAAGRALLALLPAGRPGSHAPRHLAATLGWSWLLGLAFSAPLPTHNLALPFALAVAAGYRFLGPAAMVPRHERVMGAPRGTEHALWIAPLAAAALGLWLGHSPLDAAALVAALSIGPGAASRAHPATPLILSGLGIAVSLLPLLPFGIFFAAYPAIWSWLARAERRGLSLAAFVLGVVAATGAPLAAGLAIAAFSSATHHTSRRVAFLQTFLGVLAGVGLAWWLDPTA